VRNQAGHHVAVSVLNGTDGLSDIGLVGRPLARPVGSVAMENAASPVDRRRQVVLLRIGGFTSLALGLVGGIAGIALTVVAIVGVVGEFQTVDVPESRVVTLEPRHYVI
jgi:hypothetical protein